MLKIGSEYNLNNVKEIYATDDFVTLDKSIRNCQNDISLQECQTRKYNDAMVKHCNCLPFAIRNGKEASSIRILLFIDNQQ